MSNRVGNVCSGASLALIASLILIGCGGSEKDDEPENDAGIVVVTDGGHGVSDAGPADIDAGPVISDGGSGQCTQADQYCNADDRNGMRCKNGDWVVWTCKAGTTCSRADNGYLSCVPVGGEDGGIPQEDAGIDAGIEDAGIHDAGMDDAGIHECDAGYFGENCDPCTCVHGTCDEGRAGNGKCSAPCDGNWSGDNCDICDDAKYYGKNCLAYGSMTDDAGNPYKTVIINGQEWMAENMAYPGDGTATICYANVRADSDFVEHYGCLYFWNDAREVCPTGWHLPTDAEFRALINYILTDTADTSGEVKVKYLQAHGWNNGLNTYGFGALPAGDYSTESSPPFARFGEEAGFWSDTALNSTNAIYLRVPTSGSASMSTAGGRTTDACSVRCLRD